MLLGYGKPFQSDTKSDSKEERKLSTIESSFATSTLGAGRSAVSFSGAETPVAQNGNDPDLEDDVRIQFVMNFNRFSFSHLQNGLGK